MDADDIPTADVSVSPELVRRLPVPAPVRTGQPGRGYPWAWSVVPLLPGDIAARTPPADPGEAARPRRIPVSAAPASPT